MSQENSVFVERLKVIFGDNAEHNCYCAAVEECRMYWGGQISLPVKTNGLENNLGNK
jgi:hypothetical protein